MTIIDKFISLGVEVKSNRTEQKVKCPNCVTIGKTNINDTCLSINLSTGLYLCHKCNFKGCVAEKENRFEKMQIVYKLPEKPNITKLSKEALYYFESRGIINKLF